MNDFSRFVWGRREKILSRGWTASCVAPRHVEASRNFDCISFERAAWGGGGGGLPDFLFLFFRVGNQYAECEKQQQLYSYCCI